MGKLANPTGISPSTNNVPPPAAGRTLLHPASPRALTVAPSMPAAVLVTSFPHSTSFRCIHFSRAPIFLWCSYVLPERNEGERSSQANPQRFEKSTPSTTLPIHFFVFTIQAVLSYQQIFQHVIQPSDFLAAKSGSTSLSQLRTQS